METVIMPQANLQAMQADAANDFDFVSFKQEMREVIQLLRA
jgi:hypothetical protein